MSDLQTKTCVKIKLSEFEHLKEEKYIERKSMLLKEINGLDIKIPVYFKDNKMNEANISLGKNNILIQSTVDLRNKPYEFQEDADKIYIDKDRRIEKENIALSIEMVILDFFLACNLAYPGALHITNIEITADDKKIENRHINKLYSDLFTLSEERGIEYECNNLETIKFRKVWSWVVKHKNFWNEETKSSIERAWNCFRNTFIGDSTNPVLHNFMVFFWAIGGLEAIYVENSNFSKSQLTKKILEFLKRRFIDEQNLANIETRIKKFYKFRSSLFHGNENILYSFLGPFAGVAEKKYFNLADFSDFSLYILIATFQEVIIRDYFEIGFEENITYFPKDPSK